MGRKSVKKNPNIYQRLRDGLDLTREEASELLEAISADRIEKIENERSPAQPEEVLLMSEKYKAPSLCNYYCANECPIGRRYVPEVKVSNLAQIILQMVSSLNAVSSQKDRLIEIAADSQIENDELEDFVSIQEQLEQIWINLIGNAIKFTPDGGVIGARCDKPGGTLVVEIFDNGIALLYFQESSSVYSWISPQVTLPSISHPAV